jgi:succinate dehydrogenase / fumarate reductase flavoprotein subunit
MYYKIVDEDPYKTPMMIYLQFYTMGGTGLIIHKLQFQVVSHLENPNFSDHGANRLGAL